MILIATPTRDTVTAGTTADLIRLCRRHPDARFMAPLGIYISNLRQSAVMAAQQIGASHILFVDSDMRFPEDALDQLKNESTLIIGANYVQRTMPEWWCARLDGRPLSSQGRTRLQGVDSLGFGLILIDMHVFDTLERPWFDTPYDGLTHIGEDVMFCRHATDAGYTVYVHHDLSQQVRHQGMIDYGVSTDLQADVCRCWIGGGGPWRADRNACPVHSDAALLK